MNEYIKKAIEGAGWSVTGIECGPTDDICIVSTCGACLSIPVDKELAPSEVARIIEKAAMSFDQGAFDSRWEGDAFSLGEKGSLTPDEVTQDKQEVREYFIKLSEAVSDWCDRDIGEKYNKTCPRCGSHAFLVTAHVTQDWKVDGNGNFISCLADCVEVTHVPDDEDIWVCAQCGYDAAGSEFA